jgi:hypothetical protein
VTFDGVFEFDADDVQTSNRSTPVAARLSRLSWEFDLRPGDSGPTLCDGLLHVNSFA